MNTNLINKRNLFTKHIKEFCFAKENKMSVRKLIREGKKLRKVLKKRFNKLILQNKKGSIECLDLEEFPKKKFSIKNLFDFFRKTKGKDIKK